MTAPRAHHLAALAALVVAPSLAFATPAAAHDMPDDLRPRLEAVCARVPIAEDRIERLLTRIDGDESTRGSLARLEARRQRAADEDRDDAQLVLTNRIATRTAARDLLVARQTEVATISELCDEHSVDTSQ